MNKMSNLKLKELGAWELGEVWASIYFNLLVDISNRQVNKSLGIEEDEFLSPLVKNIRDEIGAALLLRGDKLKKEERSVLFMFPESEDEITSYIQTIALPAVLDVFPEFMKHAKKGSFKDSKIAIESFGVAFSTKLDDMLVERERFREEYHKRKYGQ